MTPNTIVRCIDDRQSEGRLVKGRLYVVKRVWRKGEVLPTGLVSGYALSLFGVPNQIPSAGLAYAYKASRFAEVNRKDLETELLAKVADKIVGGARG